MTRIERQAKEAIRLAYRGQRVTVNPAAYADVRPYLLYAVEVLTEWHLEEKADQVLGEIFRLDAIHARRETTA